jgi:hypothetical protein
MNIARLPELLGKYRMVACLRIYNGLTMPCAFAPNCLPRPEVASSGT